MDSSMKEAMSYSGFLEKKSPSLFGGWQKRFFRVLEGKVLAYAANETSKEYKGTINLDEISDVKSDDKKCFEFGGRTWDLKAETEEIKDEWVNVLNLLTQSRIRSKTKSSETLETSESVRNRSESNAKAWKKNQQDQATLEILKKSGYQSKDDELSSKALKAKLKYLNPESPEIKSRIKHGFLLKKHKNDYLFQKRWFFIISSRPLNDLDYEKDEQTLFKNPAGINLDTLYYYKFKTEEDESQPKGEINLSECSEIAALDTDGKFLLVVDMGDRKYEFESEIKGERDNWYNCLKNSRRTAKEIKKSFTKKPRNVSKLLKVIENEGIGKFKEVVEKEKETILNNSANLKDFDLLENFYIKNLQDNLYQTLDGCIVGDIPRTEIIKTYAEIFNTSYLVLVKNFWKDCYIDIDQTQLLKLANLLFEHEETMTNFGVTDPNFSQNARELIKIFVKKSFMNLKTIIESILKMEREVKAVRASDGLFITNGPIDLFKMLYSLVDIYKKEKHKSKYIIEQFLYLFKECILDYLVGLDCVTSMSSLEIDKEFLIGIANNSIKINFQFEDLIDEVKTMNILAENEMDEFSGKNDVLKSLVFIADNAISRFVLDLSTAVMVEFEDQFLSLEVSKILDVTFETYGSFTSHMHASIQKKCWKEVLKATLFQYIKSLLTTAHKNVKKIDDLTNKLRSDKQTLISAYQRVLGENTTLETLRILDDFLDFLDVSAEMMSVSCSKLREFNGPSFTLNTCKALINLRCDFTKDEKNDAIKTCKDILTSFTNNPSETNKGSGFFRNMEIEIENEERLAREENMNSDDLDEVREVKDKDEKRNSFNNLSDFLNLGIDASDLYEDQEKSTALEESNKMIKINKNEPLIDTDVSMEGVMKKKSYNTWQERFFQLKNGFLYWYKEKSSKESQNSLKVAQMKKVQTHKAGKFLIVSGDKVYKFSCKDDEEKEKWIKAIDTEIKKTKETSNKKVELICDIKLKKKVIEDFYNLPNIHTEKLKTKARVDEAIRNENSFKEKSKSKPTTKVSRKLLESKTINYDAIERNETSVRMDTKDKMNFSSLNIGLIDKKPKKTNSIFSCCNQLIAMFKKRKTAQDYDD